MKYVQLFESYNNSYLVFRGSSYHSLNLHNPPYYFTDKFIVAKTYGDVKKYKVEINNPFIVDMSCWEFNEVSYKVEYLENVLMTVYDIKQEYVLSDNLYLEDNVIPSNCDGIIIRNIIDVEEGYIDVEEGYIDVDEFSDEFDILSKKYCSSVFIVPSSEQVNEL